MINGAFLCLQKTSKHYENFYFYIIFHVIEICFWFQNNEGNSNNENQGGIFILFLLIM